MAWLDRREELAEGWEGVVDRVYVRERVGVVHNSVTGTAPVREWTEAILYCRRDDGTEEEYELDADDPYCQTLLALEPGSRLVKEAGDDLPRAL